MSDVLFLYNHIEKYPNEIQLCDCFFGCGLQLIKGKKNVDELFSAVEYMIITKLIITERIVVFGSDIFVLCSLFFQRIFYWFDDSIDHEFVDYVDETDDCQRVIQLNDLVIMSEPLPTRCQQFSSYVIFFDEICNNCKKHYIKKISSKFLE